MLLIDKAKRCGRYGDARRRHGYQCRHLWSLTGGLYGLEAVPQQWLDALENCRPQEAERDGAVQYDSGVLAWFGEQGEGDETTWSGSRIVSF